jgi:SsrA-binding protein
MKKQSTAKRISNRRASHDYELGDSLVVGVELTGAEVKALRTGHGHLRGAYVTIKDNELWLLNATITGTTAAPLTETEQTKTRKLLARRREIATLQAARDQGLTLVPLELLTGSRYIKLRLAPGKGRRQYDKRQLLKQRDSSRQIAREGRIL